MSATMSSHVNSPFTESKPFQNACNQNPAQNQSKPNSVDLAEHPMAKNDDQILDPEPMSTFVPHESKYDKNPSDHEHYPNNDHPLQKPIHELLDECYKNLVGNNPLRSVPRNQDQVPKRFGVEISDDDDEKTEVEDNDDGRTHSLSHRKYGPYICPKCKKVFVTSQFFAAHVSASHYNYETMTERKRRLAARYRKKNLQLVQSSDGLTLVPVRSFKRPGGRRKKVKMGIKIEQDQVQKEGDDSFDGAIIEDDKLVDVVV